MLSRNSFL